MVCKNLKELEKRWKEIGEKIEKKSLDKKQALSIITDFLDEIMFFETQKKEESKDLLLAMQEITHSLNVSLQIAVSNYERFAKPSWIQKIFGKPEVNIDINAIKNKF